jgi:2-polyprenyl-3-methyl-5-hydroxy-6-metoxy-1,4-benzoquinol methylase
MTETVMRAEPLAPPAQSASASHGNAARKAHDVVLRELLERMTSGKVIDVPCGSGALALRMGQAGLSVTGVDIEPPAVNAPYDHREADLDAGLPFPDAEFDAVVSVEGIEHLENPFRFVRECNRVLRDDGLLIMTTPNISSLRSRWRWFLSGFHYKAKYALDETNASPLHHINMLSYHRLRYILHTNGFRIEEVTTNRIKPVSWLYLPFVPLVFAASRLAIARARKNEINRRVSDEVCAAMMRPALLFGELMIFAARKGGPPRVK